MIEPIKVLVDIIQSQLQLANGQVMIAYQKWDIPTTGLFVMLNYLGPAKTIGIVNFATANGPGAGDGMTENQSLTKRYLIQVDVMSFDDSARLSKELVELALFSIYAEQQSEANAMQIARLISGWTDVSQLEETKFLNRYTTVTAVTAQFTKPQPVDTYYSDFTRAVPPEVTTNP